MSDIPALDQAYHIDANIEVGKFTCLGWSSVNYADGCNAPGGANSQLLGVAQESILPDGFADYVAGVYTLVTGTPWPTGVSPTGGLGLVVRVRHTGISRVVASGAINRGDWVNIADNQDRIKTVNEATGTLIYVVGQAIDAAENPGDVIRVLVMPICYKA